MTDEEHPDYSEMEAWFDKVSISMIPGLLVSLVEAGYRRDVFQPGGASSIVCRVETQLGIRVAQNAPDRARTPAGDQ